LLVLLLLLLLVLLLLLLLLLVLLLLPLASPRLGVIIIPARVQPPLAAFRGEVLTPRRKDAEGEGNASVESGIRLCGHTVEGEPPQARTRR
jgi:hypothetical protein